MAAAIDHLYRYEGSSELVPSTVPRLTLVTSGGVAEHPCFFRGAILDPRLAALLLRGVSRIVGARFYVPPAMLEKILALADPVVTSGSGVLRFEGFSGCASAYARVDLLPPSYDGEVVSSGTTNVDFNAKMRAGLASIGRADRMTLAIGKEEVRLEREGMTVVERKVPLPLRWLRGFVEVQAYQARMKPRFELPGPEALRFLRALPRASTAKHASWVVPSGRSVRLSATETPGALRVTGTERLRVLEDLAPYARSLRGFGDEAGEASAWELDFGASRFFLLLSGEVWRGFSGEGQALSALARMDDARSVLARVRAELRFQAALDLDGLSAKLGVARAEVESAAAALGSRGLVGFDLATMAYFHRELPFDLALVEELHPRLTAARDLLEKHGVRFVPGATATREAEVQGSGVVHRVHLAPTGARCTCPWFAKHQGARGPCKHVLAAQIASEEEA